MKLSDFKGEEALDVLADLIEPAADIMSDEKIMDMYHNGTPKLLMVKDIIKTHKKEVIKVLAILDRENPDTYADKITLVTLPLKVMELINDEDLVQLFQSQSQTIEGTTFGSATENTEAEEN